jgi:signal transduction histidine kinase
MPSARRSKRKRFRLPFRPRARLLQLLGDQLIGNPRLAVFELVKNGYDADAERVSVILKDIEKPIATVIVKDDGDGMTPDTIRNIWLVPGHDHREVQRKELRRTRLGRLPLGEKGLGRFAVHKLGDQIELITRAKNSPECVVNINWDELISKPYLADANVTVHTRPPEVFKGKETGTRITVGRLRQASWSRGEVRRLLRQITSISSPFAKRSDRFEADLQVPDHPDWVSGIPDIEILLERAPWRFSFKFERGLLNWIYEFRGVAGIKLAPRHLERNDQPLLIPPERDLDVYGTDQGVKTKGPRRVTADSSQLTGIGPVRGEIFVFDRDQKILKQLGDSELVQNFLDGNGGIRVYRDSIRVYNYGEPGDDWLGLDLRRVNTPTRNISRNIVVGAIDLTLADSTELTEKTNREGFVENDAYHRLRQVILGALAVLEVERKKDKDNIRTLTDTGHDPEKPGIARPLEELRMAVRKHGLSAELDPLINKTQKNYDEMRDTFLRAGLSGLGLAVVFHEIEQGVRVLHSAIEAGGKLQSIQVQARELVRILDGFTELLRKGDRKTYSLKHLIRRVRDINSVRFRNHKVRLVCPFLEDSVADVERDFAFGLLLGALNNLLDNAFYWLQVRWPDGSDGLRQIYINVESGFAEGPSIIVADNGPGFQDDPQQLTHPFFSRRPDGMGVGLYYTNMVMELNGGRLLFPQAGDAGIPDRFDGAALALSFSRGS